MNKQEVFDKVSTHLLTQMKQSSAGEDDGFMCLYRSLDGLKCAIGCLIPDEFYHPSFEGKRVGMLTHVLNKIGLQVDYVFLMQLQRIHDTYPPCSWKDLLKEVAFNWNLDWNHADFENEPN
jgi:hypothetical protein